MEGVLRRLSDRALRGLAAGSALVAVGLFAAIALVLAQRGLPALDWRFVFTGPGTRVASGGVLYQIVGTLLLVATALAASLPLAVGLALLETVYLPRPGSRNGRSGGASRLRLWLYAANGTPSILFGLFGLALFGNALGWGKSWLAGGLVLGCMILPTLAVALVERIDAVPRKYLAAAAGLGLRRSQVVWSVLLPQSWQGLVSGALLGLARAAGETAPILFTAAVFAGATLPDGIRDSPVLALPYHVFVLAQDSFDPAAGEHLWGSALVLLLLVFGLSLAALPFRLALSEEARHG